MFIFTEHIRKLTIEFLCLFEIRLSNTLSIFPFQGWNTLGVFFLTIDVPIVRTTGALCETPVFLSLLKYVSIKCTIRSGPYAYGLDTHTVRNMYIRMNSRNEFANREVITKMFRSRFAKDLPQSNYFLK